MSEKIETFPSDIGQVTIDTGKKKITIDGKPLHEVVSEKSAMELLIKDLAIDRELMTALRANMTNLKSWLPGIGNRQAREIFRKFIDDSEQCLKAMIAQKNLQMITLIRMEKEWQKNQSPVKSATDAELNVKDAIIPLAVEATPAPDALASQPEFQ